MSGSAGHHHHSYQWQFVFRCCVDLVEEAGKW